MTDAEIIQATLRGDKNQFRKIVERYQNSGCAVAYSIIQDFSASRTIALEAFTQAYLKLRKLRNPEKFGKWFLKIVRNLSLNFVRGKKITTLELDKVDDTYENVEREFTKQELRDIVHGSVMNLSDKTREAMLLFYWEGQSIKEISQLTGIKESAIKNRLFMGRKKIREELFEVIEEYLGKLRPSKEFTNKVMVSLPAAPLKAGITALSLPAFSLKILGFPFLLISQTLLLFFWKKKLFTEDLAEKNGLQKHIFSYHLWRWTLVMILLFLGSSLLMAYKPDIWYLIMIGFFVFLLLPLTIKRIYLSEKGNLKNRMYVQLTLLILWLAVFLGNLLNLHPIAMALLSLTILFPLYFLFKLKASLNFIPRQDRSIFFRYFDSDSTPYKRKEFREISGKSLLHFARLLFTNFYIKDSKALKDGRIFFLPAVKSSGTLFPGKSSYFIINFQGDVKLFLSDSDFIQLESLVRTGFLHSDKPFDKANLKEFIIHLISKIFALFIQEEEEEALSLFRGEADSRIFKSIKSTTVVPEVLSKIVIWAFIISIIALFLVRLLAI